MKNRIKDIYSTIWKFSKFYIFITIFIKIITLMNTYIILYFNKLILDEISLVIREKTLDGSFVFLIIALMILLDLVATILVSILQYLLGKQKMRFDDKLTLKISYSVANLDMAYYDDPEHYNQTRLLYQYSNSIIGNFNNIIDFFFSVFSLIIALTLITSVSVWLSIIAILSVIPSFLMRRRINIRNFHFGKEVVKEKRYVDYLSSMLINKSVIREFQIYHYESYLINKIENHQEKYRNLKINNSLKNARSEMILMILEKTTSFFQQVLLITSIISHSLTVGDYSYIGGVTAKLKSSVNQLLGLISEINITDIQYRHFTEIINRKPSIYTDGTMDPPNGKKVIEFKNVSFKYPNCNNYAIKNVSFTYDSNEKIALVGQNGSGKSTLIKLLLRFYDPTEGEILLNGINVKEYNVDKYRGIFASMFQDPLIYSLSIEENVALNKTEEINSERVSEILSLLNLNQEIDIKRQYGREFDPNGYVFSAGQRQRLYSARTLYHNRDIYILDEPAASMDALSEYEFFNALHKYTRDRGLIYITHRYGILNKMNKILVLEYGELIESGNHSELINQQGLYFKMYKLQEKEFNTVKKEHFYET